ncbi:FeoA family protein [Faecalicoccus acidiformans]|uniref:Ferrous iron transport protein A n=1 Tax=Faecalicoccus acidiformans TaxID=915173 RepID=A0ABS2FKN8_9FIRM|nr:FeoA family protein [Faecalicoccus acidiformans]MBM6830531.1 ferrous iron transport protein A [Faecalicoccus acidiformans]MDM8204081.1 FeoA family protein [Faecalicoccus acidiformans]
MRLKEGTIGIEYIVSRLDLGMHLKDRLQSLGMITGTQIEVIHKKKNGTMVIDLRGTRFALGSHITDKIEVTPCQEK